MEEFLCHRLLDPTQPISERFRELSSLFATSKAPVPAAEALGAIGLESSMPMLKNSLVSNPAQEVREACELALSRIEDLKTTGDDNVSSMTEKSMFMSVDPAAPASFCSSVAKLSELLLDEEKGMYERYAALFALRNNGGEEAVSAIIDSLSAKSALLKHEVAYVLGQLQNKAASAALSNILRDVNEHPMVRHEATEALGSIADTDIVVSYYNHSVALLVEFARDPDPIVSESCEVALSMLEYERSVPLHAGSSSAIMSHMYFFLTQNFNLK
ncbi:hypothetical protein EZV62_010785 [Acer yangbiense]|uniref:deoxyhypusine monooxygenase n=1 Tax=Acer yangbiense TaxID=1000413 RepID=A0A5C7I3H1_9ROSI|nr:hypothetical protein EZV62_010785 [Acer yangbiense]